jgi:hypothetical protein
MKTMLFISGLIALVQALLIVVTGAFEVYNSYRYTITPISDYDGLGGGTIVLVAPFILFLVALYFSFFCVFIHKRHLSFPSKLFADLYCSCSDCWHGIILRCLGALSSPRLLVDLDPGSAHFISNCDTLLLEGSCSERANGVKGSQ